MAVSGPEASNHGLKSGIGMPLKPSTSLCFSLPCVVKIRKDPKIKNTFSTRSRLLRVEPWAKHLILKALKALYRTGLSYASIRNPRPSTEKKNRLQIITIHTEARGGKETTCNLLHLLSFHLTQLSSASASSFAHTGEVGHFWGQLLKI